HRRRLVLRRLRVPHSPAGSADPVRDRDLSAPDRASRVLVAGAAPPPCGCPPAGCDGPRLLRLAALVQRCARGPGGFSRRNPQEGMGRHVAAAAADPDLYALLCRASAAAPAGRHRPVAKARTIADAVLVTVAVLRLHRLD